MENEDEEVRTFWPGRSSSAPIAPTFDSDTNNFNSHLDLTAPTRYMGPRRLLKEGVLVKAKSGRRLHAVLCNDIMVLMDAHAQSLYRMVRTLYHYSRRTH